MGCLPGRCPSLDGEVNLGITGDIDALTIKKKDLRSGFTACYLKPDTSADRFITAINHFRGSRRTELLSGDNSKKHRKAADIEEQR